MKGKKLLSLLLALVLCVSTWMESVGVVKAADGTAESGDDLRQVTTSDGKTKFEDQIEIDNGQTKIEVQVNGQPLDSDRISDSVINLLGIDSNKQVSFSIRMAYKVKYGTGEDEDSIENRTLKEGDFFTITIPKELKFDETYTLPQSLNSSDGRPIVELSQETAGADDASIITFVFTDCVDSDVDITFSMEMTLVLDKDTLSAGDTKKVTLDIPGKPYEIILPDKASTEPEEIEKIGEYDSDDHTITWTIKIKPENRSLSGYTLTDTLDTTYQELVSVSWPATSDTLYKMAYDSNGTAEEEVAGKGVKVTDGKTITYTFADGATSDGTFTVVTRLNNVAETALLNAAGTGDEGTASTEIRPSNTVSLEPPAGVVNDIEEKTEEVEVTRSGKKVITKGYEQISADVLRWTITVNPDRARIWKAVVTDKLSTSPKLTLIEDTVKVYEGETATGIGTVVKDNSGESIYYTYTEDTEDPADGSETNTLAVTFQEASLANKTYTLTFDTRIEVNTGYDTITDNNVSKSISFTNNASIRCSFPDPGGEGKEESWQSGGITVTAMELMLNKNCTDFNKSTGMITWSLQPSCGNAKFGTVTITDYVGQQSAGTGLAITHSTPDGANAQTLDEDNANVKVKLREKEISDEEYNYSILINENDNTLIITFNEGGVTDGSGSAKKDFTSDDLNNITITYQTHADDWGVTETGGKAAKQIYYNTAVMQVDNKVPVFDNADKTATDDMITKTAASWYDDETGKSGFSYTINVNNDGVKLTGATLTDDLSGLVVTCTDSEGNKTETSPELVLARVTVKAGTVNEVIYDAYDDDNDSGGLYSKEDGDTLGKLTLPLDNYVTSGLKVAVTVDVEIANSAELFMENCTVSAVNTAYVNTAVSSGSQGIFAAANDASKGQIKNKRVTKTHGELSVNEAKEQIIPYSIYINPWAADMGEVTLTDTLSNQFVTYDNESFILYEAKNDNNGGLSRGDRATDGWSVSFMENDDGASKAIITIDSCARPYILEYGVLLLSGVSGKIYNNVELLSGGAESDSSGDDFTVTGSGAASSSPRKNLTVKKLYQNPVTGKDDPLPKAAFGLYNISGDGTVDKAAVPSKTAVANENGEAVFKGLKPDTTYCVKEIEAPAGYEIGGADAAEEITISSSGNNVLTFYNTRSTAAVEFTKTDDSEEHNGLGGAGFRLYYNEGDTVKLVRTAEVSGEEGVYQFEGLAGETEDAGNMITSASSGGNIGRVKVTGLPWGEGAYYFVEVQAPEGYQVNTTRKYCFTVQLNTENAVTATDAVQVTYKTVSPDSYFTEATAGEKTEYRIENSKYKFSLLKQDENEKPIPGVTFGLYTDKACTSGSLVKFEGDSGNANLFTTGADGRVTIDDNAIKGNTTYYLKEISAPAEFSVSDEAIAFTLSENDYRIQLEDKDKNETYQVNAETNCLIITDKTITAPVELLKQDTDGNAIKGVTFDLYKLDGVSGGTVKDLTINGRNISNLTINDLQAGKYARRIAEDLATDADGYWKSGKEEKTYEDSLGSTRKISNGLTGGWYCFVETSVPGNEIKSAELYWFCIKEQAVSDGSSAKTVVVTDADGEPLKDSRLTITNKRITAYLSRQWVDSNGVRHDLESDAENKLALTLYEKDENGGWKKVCSFGNTGTVGTNAYYYDISTYLRTGGSYKVAETSSHSVKTYMKAYDYYFQVDNSGTLYQITENGDGDASLVSLGDSGTVVMTSNEATMSIQGIAGDGVFSYTLYDKDGEAIASGQIDGDAGNTQVIQTQQGQAYRLQRGTTYTLGLTYYPTGEDAANGTNSSTATIEVTCNEYGELEPAEDGAAVDSTAENRISVSTDANGDLILAITPAVSTGGNGHTGGTSNGGGSSHNHNGTTADKTGTTDTANGNENGGDGAATDGGQTADAPETADPAEETSSDPENDGGGTGDIRVPDSQAPAAAADAENGAQDKEAGRSIKTGDRTPIAIYAILSIAAAGIFGLLTALLKRRKKTDH